MLCILWIAPYLSGCSSVVFCRTISLEHRFWPVAMTVFFSIWTYEGQSWVTVVSIEAIKILRELNGWLSVIIALIDCAHFCPFTSSNWHKNGLIELLIAVGILIWNCHIAHMSITSCQKTCILKLCILTHCCFLIEMWQHFLKHYVIKNMHLYDILDVYHGII